MNKTNQYPLNKPIDNGIKTMLQHQAYMVSNNQMLSSVKIIELAARCNYPNLHKIVKDAFHSYNDIQYLIKYFLLCGVDPYPDSSWDGSNKMQEVFTYTKEDMISRLNDEAIEKLKNRGIIK